MLVYQRVTHLLAGARDQAILQSANFKIVLQNRTKAKAKRMALAPDAISRRYCKLHLNSDPKTATVIGQIYRFVMVCLNIHSLKLNGYHFSDYAGLLLAYTFSVTSISEYVVNHGCIPHVLSMPVASHHPPLDHPLSLIHPQSQPSVALQIQQELFDFDATAIPSGSVDAVQEIFCFHLAAMINQYYSHHECRTIAMIELQHLGICCLYHG